MQRHKAYRFELDPNNVTKTLFYKYAGTARFVYNWSLARRIDLFKTQEGKNKFTNAFSEQKELDKIKRTEFPWMYEVSSRVPMAALRDLDRAFTNFWKGRKQGVGFPKFKKKGQSKDSFRLYESIRLQDHHIKLPRLGLIRTKEEVVTPPGKIISATVSRQANRWFVSLNVVEVVPDPLPIGGPTVGVDFGVSTFATLSSQNEFSKIQAPNPLRSAIDKLARAQRKLSRKKKGSKNWKKTTLKVAKIYAKITNVRQDFIHKFTTNLAKTKSMTIVEDLNIRGMVKNRSLARSISDQGWGEAKRQLEYKATWYGSQLVVADRFFSSSKLCSGCGLIRAKLELATRRWTCEGCGSVHDRDENAARNLELLGS